MSADPLADFRALIDIYETGIVWHCVCAVARLEVPDRLADGPLPVAQLAADTGVHSDPLLRVLRLLADHDQQAVFDEQMQQQAQVLSLTCVPILDWPATGTIADIGGGLGTLLAAVLQTAPGARGILVDQPHVLDRARPFLDSQGVADRCDLRPGDLFAPPPAADMYLLARVLHDWGDDDASASSPRLPTAPQTAPACGCSRASSPRTAHHTAPRWATSP